MTPEAQRIAIAEVCGVCTHPKDKRGWYEGGSESNDSEYCTICRASETMGGSLNPLHGIPDYLNDLNAMHEAEKVLTEVQQVTYAGLIADAVKSRHWAHLGFDCLHVTAPQRAEAFLRTLGKWEDGK